MKWKIIYKRKWIWIRIIIIIIFVVAALCAFLLLPFYEMPFAITYVRESERASTNVSFIQMKMLLDAFILNKKKVFFYGASKHITFSVSVNFSLYCVVPLSSVCACLSISFYRDYPNHSETLFSFLTCLEIRGLFSILALPRNSLGNHFSHLFVNRPARVRAHLINNRKH